MITFTHVTKRFPGGHEALRDVTFSVKSGELVTVVGRSGAGKTTLLKLISAIELPSTGNVVVSGQNTKALRPAAVPYLRRKFGLVFQDYKLLFDRSALENVLLPLHIVGLDGRDATRRARAALDKVGLLPREKAMPVTLSGGEQQRLCIARAVVNRPAVLLADEPTGNLDEAYAREIVELFRSFHQVGTTVVISTHDRAVQDRLAGRTLVLTDGTLADSAHG